MKDERQGELEHQYQADRATILGDESMSWEKKMLALRTLFDRYRVKREQDGEEG